MASKESLDLATLTFPEGWDEVRVNGTLFAYEIDTDEEAAAEAQLMRALPMVLPADCFPVVIEALHAETRRVLWTKEIAHGQTDCDIPALARKLGDPVRLRFSFGYSAKYENLENARAQRRIDLAAGRTPEWI